MRRTEEWYAQRQADKARAAAQVDMGAVAPATSTGTGTTRRKAVVPVRGDGQSMPVPVPRAVAFALPWPPSKNELYVYPSKRLTDEYKQFRAAVARLISELRITPFDDAAIAIDVRTFPPNDRGDMPNIDVATLDALQAAGLFPNDKTCKRLHLEEIAKRDRVNAAIHVTVSVLCRS